MTVKRYDMREVFKGRQAVIETSCGAFVTHSDYAALKAELDEARGQVVSLAVELSAVEAIHTECVFITDEIYEQCLPEVQKVIRSLAVMQMPSAKEAIANWQARGVDKAISKLEASKFGDEGDLIVLRKFAAELRKGASND